MYMYVIMFLFLTKLGLETCRKQSLLCIACNSAEMTARFRFNSDINILASNNEFLELYMFLLIMVDFNPQLYGVSATLSWHWVNVSCLLSMCYWNAWHKRRLSSKRTLSSLRLHFFLSLTWFVLWYLLQAMTRERMRPLPTALPRQPLDLATA